MQTKGGIAMFYHCIFAMNRKFEENVVGLSEDYKIAKKIAKKIAHIPSIVRCRIVGNDLTEEQIKVIWYAWGKSDAKDGFAPHDEIPLEYQSSYKTGYQKGKKCN